MDICRRKFGACILGGLVSRAWAIPPRPKLLVLVILEQIRPDYLDAVWGQVGTGGLRRLIENGSYYPDCRHLASSFPSSSLATLATGCWPAQHGIVADSWFEGSGSTPVRASEETLLATTLAAQVAAAPNTRLFVLSLEAAQGRLFSGTSDARYFFLDGDGRFTSSGDVPAWLEEYNRLKPLENLYNSPWIAAGAKPGAPPLRTLTFDAAKPEEFLRLYTASPFAQGAQFELVAELVRKEKLGQGNTFDFVCVLASSTARLGYETGARSPLMQQMTLQLDRQIETLLNQLDRAPGGNTYNFVLVGAHGAPPEPLPDARARMAVNGEKLAQAIQQKFSPGEGAHLSKYLYPFLYLDETPGGGSPPARLAAARESRLALARAAIEQPAVAAYYTAGGDCSVRDDWERRFRNSFHPLRSGDVMLSYRPEYIEDYGTHRGVSYGSLYNYDVKVPLCFFGPQFHAEVFEYAVESVDVAATLARAIGVAPPSSSIGRVLGDAFASAEDVR